MVEVPGCRQDHAIPRVAGAHMTHHGLARHIAHGFDTAEHGPSEGLVWKSRHLKVVEHTVVGCIVCLPDFLDYDGTFTLELLRFES